MAGLCAAAARTGKATALAVDGVIVEQASHDPAEPVTGSFAVGRQPNGGCIADGVIDEIKLSSWAKSAAELTLSMANGIDPG